ncbi:MAG TPA: cyclic nucleotide-binding and patatin-like phospholipase domain-containing protein [Solirubrobacteraceae bacterium]|jgi:predicted acylesterase/phospholipase RssA/CRP-like cAMP-binding protein|nr:cyclic nucleotide-binding and patatin-like phospholipase domain-containing protein [Solirubrobacteraceae bacterium]
MSDVPQLARAPLFAGLDAEQLELVARAGRRRAFGSGEVLCRAGEPSERCWVITEGLVDALGRGGGEQDREIVARHRKGATVGEVGVILGEPQAETLVASIPTVTLELGAEELGGLVQRCPAILRNGLRSLHGRLSHTHARAAERKLGETVALALGPSLRGVLPRLLAAARTATPQSVTALDRDFSFAGAIVAADDLVSAHATVVLPAELDAGPLAAHLREADRVIALVGSAEEAAELGRLRRAPGLDTDVEVVVFGAQAAGASGAWAPDAALRIVRTCPLEDGSGASDADLAWVARHLTRTKLGLALGAGGAKGYAHVGVLQVLEEAGYAVDYVSGSSIGAIVATYVALGADASEIDATLRGAFDEETVAEIFKTSLGGRGGGLDVMRRLLRETTEDRTFADARIPLTIMAVDLCERAPAALRDGSLWQALLAATALAGVFPPYERDGMRLVDGLALVPVPTGAIIEAGADVTVSVNLIGPTVLASWPGGAAPEPLGERRRRGVLDNLLEVMDLSQLAESVRHAELADVVITPTFGPCEWRDFHLADLFLAAGRAAAQEQLANLASLASPVTVPSYTHT